MRRLVMLFGLCLTLGISAVTYAVAQDTSATPTADAVLCGSPGASPVAEGEATPAIQTSGSPEAIATSVVENVVGSLDEVACGTPAATPGV